MSTTSTFLYGIVSDSHPKRLAGLRGIGAKPSSLRAVPAGELAVVVSDAPADIRPKRRDLLAHEVVLEALCAQGPTLPMRFGVLADGDESIAREVAAERHRYLQLLADLGDRVEMNVKVKHDQEAVLRVILAGNEPLRRMNEDLRGRGDGEQEARVQFGEMIAEALAERERLDAAVIDSTLAPHALRENEGPAVAGFFVNESFLVERKLVADFESAVGKLSEATRGYLEVQVRGPLPPYSFTDVAADTG
jgi:hypothetical protein